MSKIHISKELPSDLEKIEISEPTLISWVQKIASPSLISDYYRSFQHYKKHMYWEKSLDEFTLYGIDPVEASFEKIITNESIKGTGPIELMAGLFDESTNSQKQWGDLSESIAFLPSLLLTEVENERYVTFNFVVRSASDLLTSWEEMINKWHHFLSLEPSPVEEENKIISAEELHVNEWLEAVEESVDELKRSDTMTKIVLARQLEVNMEESINIGSVLSKLREQQPNTYRFVIRNNQDYFVGATPERLLEATDNKFSTACVAGSIERGKTKESDVFLGQQLLEDQKNTIEHSYVVQWLTSEMNHLTTQLEVINHVTLLKNRDIQHLFLPISGLRKPAVSFQEGINQLHPSPALGGFPKTESLLWIKTHEKYPRGLYGGPLGWKNQLTDIGEVVVGIRSALINDKRAILYAGCGLVEVSQADLERRETKIKFQPMLRALGGMSNE